MSPPSSRYAFVLEIDGAQAKSDAERWAREIGQHLKGITLDTRFASATNAFAPLVANARAAAGDVEQEFGQVADHLTQRLSRIPVGIDDTQFHQQMAQINRAIEQAERAAKSTERMGVSPAEWLDMGQFDRWSRAMRTAREDLAGLNALGRGMQTTGRGMMTAAATVLGGAGLAGREYLQLAEPLGQAARAMELNSQLAEELDSKLRDLAGTTSFFKPEEQAQGLYLWAAATGEVVQSSADLDVALQRTESVQKLAKLGAVDFAQAVEAVTDIQSQYQKSVGDTDKIVATLIKTAAVSKADVGDLAAAFSYVGGQAQASNVTFEETAATLNLLAAAGQRGSRAGQGLARLMENLIAPSDQAGKALDRVLGSGALKREGQFIGLADAVEVMANKTAKMTDVERQQFVAQITTQNAARALIPLLTLQVKAREENVNAIRAQQKIEAGLVDDEVNRYQRLVKEVLGYEISVKSSAQTMADQWEQYAQSLDGQATLIEARWAAAMDTIGQTVTSVALPGVEKLVAGLSKLTKEAEAHPDLVSAALHGAVAVGAVGALVTALSKPVQIAADVKALLMAKEMKLSADQNVVAAAEMLAASRNMLQAAGIEAAAGQGGGAAAAGGVTAAGKAAGLIPAITALTVAITGAKWMIDEAQKGADLQTEHRRERMGLRPEQWDFLTGEGGKLGVDARTSGLVWRDAAGELTKVKATQQEINELLREAGLLVQAVGSSDPADETQRWALMVGEADRALMAAVARAYALVPPLHEAVGLTETIGHNAYQIARGIDAASARMQALGDHWQGIQKMADAVKETMWAIPSDTDLADQVGGEAEAFWDQLVGMTGMMDPTKIRQWGDQFTRELTALYMSLRGKEQWEIDLAVQAFVNGWDARVQKVRDSAKEIESQQKEMARKAKQAYEDWKGFAGSLLQPTQVTQEDMALTKVGGYEEKWDEWVRRIRAAQTDMTSQWRKIIPTDIEQAGQDAINRWAGQQINAFYAGLQPDKVNWDALITSYDQKLNEKMGKDKLLDLFMQKLQESGRTPDEFAAMQALGLESPIQQMFLGGMTPDQVGQQLQGTVTAAMAGVKIDTDAMTLPAQGMVSALTGAMQDEINGQAWAGAIVTAFRSDITNRQQEIKALGGMIGFFVFDGMRARMRRYSIIDAIAKQVLDEIAEQIGPGKQST